MIHIDLFLTYERLVGPQISPILIYLGLASYYDIKEQKIYDWLSISMAVYNAATFIIWPLLFKEWSLAASSALGGLVTFLSVLIPAMVYMIRAGGDIKFAGATGLAFGIQGALLWLLTSVVLVLIYGVYAKTVKKQDSWTVIPFAPFMLAGLLINITVYLIII